MRLPGGAGRNADERHVVRGIGYAAGIKNLMYSEGFDDYSTARVRLADGVATVRGAGLLIAVELASAPAGLVAAELLRDGLIVNAVTPSALRLAPSLLVTDDEIDTAVQMIDAALRRTYPA